MMALPFFSPASASAVVLGKGIFHIAVKWAAFTSASAVGFLAGVIPILSGMNRCIGNAIDEQEQRALVRIRAVSLVNVALFSVGIPLLRATLPAHGRVVSSLVALVFSAIHMAIYLAWLPRVTQRRRETEARRDPQAAVRHARHDLRQRRAAVISSLVVLGVVVAAWIRGG